MDFYQRFIHISRYARYLEDKQRRETWNETVDRYINFFKEKFKNELILKKLDEAREHIINLSVMPSMRALMTAGPALENENLAGYNCAYVAINHQRVFSEILYVLMNGVGVGFSCERQKICHLPQIPSQLKRTGEVFLVQDSKKGWAEGFEKLIDHLYKGEVISLNYSLLRPAGARLKTFGGRASGPEALKHLVDFTIQLFDNAKGRRLNSLEVHDLTCKIAEIVVVGGVRRSALISLSNLSDLRMRGAKSGEWYRTEPQRALANNSVCYTEKPSSEVFLEEWLALMMSKSGERGIFNRKQAQKQASRYGRRSAEYDYGCNPCSEIILRSKQLCNLTEVIAKPGDNLNDLLEKIEIATFLGTLQASLIDFQFVGHFWSKNCEIEALLGVSISGIMDNALLNGTGEKAELKQLLETLRLKARSTNEFYANAIGINVSAAITCVKPSGTVSQLANCSSGIHPRWAKKYTRTVRIDKKDPLYAYMKNKGFYIEDDYHKPDSGAVIYFPIVAPEGCVVRSDVKALDMLELWKIYQDHFCEHKPSITIDVRPDEWIKVADWVYENFEDVSGISFLPFNDHIYRQAPYQEYNPRFFKGYEDIIISDFTDMIEIDDNTTSSQNLACTGNGCEI